MADLRLNFDRLTLRHGRRLVARLWPGVRLTQADCIRLAAESARRGRTLSKNEAAVLLRRNRQVI